MATGVYNRGKALLLNGGLDLDTQDIRVLLVSASYTFNPDHNFVADITNELSGTGYVRKELANETVTEDDTNDRAVFDADDVVWTGADFGSPAMFIVYRQVTNDADSPLICCGDISPVVATNGGDFTLAFSANGILRAS